MSERWRFFVDRGGTFTDCIALPPGGGPPRVLKLPSDDAAPLTAIRRVLAEVDGLAPTQPLPPVELRLGTTLATNALLERRGIATALVITRGFGDLPLVGDQSRPDIFALAIAPPRPLHRAVLELDARAEPDGSVSARPDPARVQAELAALRADGVESLAIVVLFGTRAPALERELAQLARAAGFAHVSCGHEVGTALGLLARTETAIVDAYTTAPLQQYLEGLQAALPGSTIAVMQSSGGLVPPGRARGKDAILSGPAGGVLATAALARAHALPWAIGLDMGGTSTDVCRVEHGEPARSWETSAAGVRVRVPMLDVHTVAAGGGSVCALVDGRLQVGPHSVGASPGPLCYGRSDGAPCLTDMNLVLGRIVPDRFPLPLVRAPLDAALQRLREAWGPDAPAPEAIAAGCFRIAVQAMADAIASITIARGHDVRDHALVAFGGAAGQHACALARSLGMRTILVPVLGGAFSAWGIGVAPAVWQGQRDADARTLDAAAATALRTLADALADEGAAALRAEGHAGEDAITALVELRYRGTESTLALPLEPSATLRERFDAQHAAALGWARPAHPIECVTVRAIVTVQAAATPPPRPAPGPLPPPRRHAPLWLDDGVVQAAIVDRELLPAGATLHGPALVLDALGTFVLEPGWRVSVEADGTLRAQDHGAAAPPDVDTRCDPITLELYAHRFMAIAEQMGVVLQRTAQSTNIRERLDFSCAVFDAEGGLVANAPHLPVHLGAMGESVAAMARMHPDAREGDVFATNDPTLGGSHLPDITVVTPVFVDGVLAFWSASRGHHADVGGTAPGSMPPDATTLAHEGVVLRGLPIVRGGRLCEPELRAALGAGPWPARSPDENLADLQAQIAANRRGATLLLALVQRESLARVQAYMGHVQDQAARAVAAAIARLPAGEHHFVDVTDDGARIELRARIGGGRLTVDFGGTSAARGDNLNAPRAVTVAAVLYVLRTLVGQPIPLNRGCLRAVELSIPKGSMLDPPPDAAIAGGNVETSQRVVDVLFAALGLKAASQGTMNNLTFGDAGFGYYETIGGGEGATVAHDGRDGVHTHMTNTRITDPELLQARFGVRVLQFRIRRGSGGAGRRRGGDGLVRELQFDRPLSVSMLADRRLRPPFGLDGGAPGSCGRVQLWHDGSWGPALPARFAITVAAGDRLRIETPGGGGFGPPAAPAAMAAATARDDPGS
ncbi:MAG: hydantoinase B/oxoprolinase family protein [Nannocystaceae bacterium]|nr:hydantoinase B/oxoprolinase family protein [Nannocystaceae bacterium]